MSCICFRTPPAHTRAPGFSADKSAVDAHTTARTLLATLAGSVAPSSSTRLRFAWFE